MNNKFKKQDKIKIFTLGNSDVGKTCFITRFLGDIYCENLIKTAGIDYQTKQITMKDG